MNRDTGMLTRTSVMQRRQIPHPKVRTGCITCKIRRVKCDEEKPHCLRCVKFGHKCDGYLTKPGSAPPRKAKTLRLLPLAKTVEFAPLHHQPESRRFISVDEFRYFKLFCESTAKHLAGYYNSALWNRVILQASEAEPSIRHAVIAIGALNMTGLGGKELKGNDLEEQCREALRTTRKQMTASNERNVFALQQYSKAIKNMRVAASSGSIDLRAALVASLLIICFETYHGNLKSAGRQIYTAVQMLDNWTTEQAYTMSDPLKLASPSPDTIEDDLMHAFIRLDLQAMSNSVDQYTMAEHFRLKDAAAAVVANMPEEFMDVTEARNYFNIIARRVVHFGRLLEPVDVIHQNDERPRLSYSDILACQKRYVTEAERWMAAFMPIFVQSRNPDNQAFLSGATLRLNYLAMYTRLLHFLDNNESLVDNEIGNYREMVHLAEILLEGDNSVFAFDLQIIWSMEVVAMKCRDHLLRRKAIQLLTSKPRREGILDSLLSAKVHLWMVGIEEEGMRDGIVPEESRVRNLGTKLDLANRVAYVSCEQPIQGSEVARMRKLQTTITW